MPPKKAAAAAAASEPLTVLQLNEANNRLHDSANPSEEDYQLLLNGLTGDVPVRQTAAQLLRRHCQKFPKLSIQSVSCQIQLSSDADANVRFDAVRGLADFLKLDSEKVIDALIKSLADSDARVSSAANTAVKGEFSRAEFQSAFLNGIKSQKAEVQAKMVEFVKDNMEFNAENSSKLIELLQVAIRSSVLEALALMSKNHALIGEDKRDELANSLVDRLESSLGTKFSDVCSTLLAPILKFTKTLGDPAVKRLLVIVSKMVLPHFEELPASVAIVVLQKLSDLSFLVEDSEVQVSLYENVILKFPTSSEDKKSVNFSIIEAALSAFRSLGRQFTNKTAILLGHLIIQSGQPSESRGVEVSATKYKAFTDRLQYLSHTAESFVQTVKDQKEAVKQDASLTDIDAKKEKLNYYSKAILTGNNTLHFCRILQKDSPFQDAPPKQLSWKKQSTQRREKPEGRRAPRQHGRRY